METRKILAEMKRAYQVMKEDLSDLPGDSTEPCAFDLIEHMESWFKEQQEEEERINRASFFARYGPERPQ